MYFAAILLLIVVLPVASVAIEARCFIPAPRRSWRFANLSMGRLGLLSLAIPARVVPAVIMGGLYYGFAGGRACPAHVSDLAIFILLAIFVATS